MPSTDAEVPHAVPAKPNPRNNPTMFKIFQNVQYNVVQHKKYVMEMIQLCRKLDKDKFCESFKNALLYMFTFGDTSANVDRVVQFVATFCTSLDDQEEFLQFIFDIIFECQCVSGPSVRYRSTQLLGAVLSALGHDVLLDEDLYDKLVAALMQRLEDRRGAVRTRAALALERLQNPMDADDDVTRAYHFHMSCDPSASVRRAIVKSIAKCTRNVPLVLERVCDVDESVRRAAFLHIAAFNVTHLRIGQRVLTLKVGLNERSVRVRRVVEEILIPGWLNMFQGNILDLLKAIRLDNTQDAMDSQYVAGKLLESLFKYEWMPPGPPSPQRSQPPVAPKPQGARRTDMEMEEQSHPQSHPQPQQPPPSNVQPEDERYVASALEPPAVSVYPAGGGGAGGAGRGVAPHNPWQREERERQHEARRAAARARSGNGRNLGVVQEGLFYSLVQSPQQFKQMLMSGGVDRYFQVARCYRDETTRPDRQPEFTQLDIELSFTNLDGVLTMIEQLLYDTFVKSLPKPPFKRMTYRDALQNYGTDKPNLTYDLKFLNLKDLFSEKSNDHNFGAYALPYTKEIGKLTTKYKEKIREYAKKHSCKVVLNENISKELGIEISKRVQSAAGDLNAAVIVLGDDENSCLCLGEIREMMALLLRSNNMLQVKENVQPLWVIDFPLFVKGENGLETCHHPFTAPHPDDMHLLDSEPLKVRSLAYDIVMNGNEIGGGSVRVHSAELQEKLLKILNIDPSKLLHFLNALKCGCPPHAGIALGIDRLVTIACNAESIREVIAFPKSHDGRDPLSGAPNSISEEDKKYYHISSAK